MRKIKPLLFVGAMLMLAACSFAGDDISFINVKGNVRLRPDMEEDNAYKSAGANSVFSIGERIKTSEKSGALLNYADSGSFAFKPDTVAVLVDKNEKKSKINLLSGEIWFNLKEEAEVTVEMSQAIAVFKGAIVTFAVSPDGLDNSLRVLKGEVNVMVKGSSEARKIYGGQGLDLRQKLADAMRNKPAKGFIDYFDTEKEEERWEEEISSVAVDLDIDDLTKQINKYCDILDSTGKAILTRYEQIMAGSGTLSDVNSLKTRISAFQGVLTEGKQYSINAKKRIAKYDAKIAEEAKKRKQQPNGEEEEQVELVDSYARTSLNSAVQRFDTILKYFSEKLGDVGIGVQVKSEPEKFIQKPVETITPIEEKLEKAYSVTDNIRKAFPKNLVGKSQRWFASARATVSECREQLKDVSGLIAEEQILYPKDRNLPVIAKRSERYIQEMDDLTRALAVPEIDPAVLSNLSDLKDDISYHTGIIATAIDEYRSISDASVAGKQKKRRELERILNYYSSVQRNYRKAERQCRAVVKKRNLLKYETAEMKEVRLMWQDIEDDFNRLDEESGTLKRIIND